MSNPKDANQASEDELDEILHIDGVKDYGVRVLKPIDVNETKAAIQSIIRNEKLKLLDELNKSMPTAEQLATRYGYHMPEKQYGYKLALHDIREVIEAERKKLI